MGVADRHGGNPRYPVLISVSFMIEQILHFAFDHQQGLCVVMEVKFGDIIFTILDYLLEGDSFIGLWFVIEGREGGRKSLRKCFADHLLKCLYSKYNLSSCMYKNADALLYFIPII